MKYDLHSHSTASDGQLAPGQLLTRAAGNGVELFALTDHDTLSGLDQVAEAAWPFTLVNGVEISAQWRGVLIHVVGLDFDRHSSSLRQHLEHQEASRGARAAVIAERLAKRQMPGLLEGALAVNGGRLGNVGRVHFAEAMVAAGYVSSLQQAFDLWLGDGKIGDVKQHWPELTEVVAWITEAGGVPVLAHPLKYKLTTTKLKLLLTDFCGAGGRALEVVSAGQNAQQQSFLAQLAAQFQVAASGGSDFHQPGAVWCELGQLPALPVQLPPVWSLFRQNVIAA